MSSKLRVLLLGATGNLGVRLIPALLSHNHAVIAYVRNPTKLKTILKPELLSPITIVEGDATDTAAMYRAIVEHDCNALICAAGNVVMNPWGKANLPGISEAAADAAILAAKERGGKPLRCWFLGGMSLLDYPRSTYFLADFIPVGREHIQTMKILQSKSVDLIKWSILCPSGMRPAVASPDLKLIEKQRKHELLTKADVASEWKDHWLSGVPIVGRYINTISAYASCMTDLEACADLIAEDLENRGTEWNFRKVGVKEKSSR